MKYSLLTCKGFPGTTGWFNFGDCMKAKLGLVFLFFLMAIINKWIFGMLGWAFNMWTAVAGSIVVDIILVSLFGSFKLALGIGLIAGILCGILGGQFLGSTSDAE